MYNSSSDLIYVNNASLSKEICLDIINLFESEDDKYPGETMAGVNINVKDTTDFVITRGGSCWDEINTLLSDELQRNVTTYITNFKTSIDNLIYVPFNLSILSADSMQAQKYKKGVGKYIMHHDFRCAWNQSKLRQLTFIWYLNDVTEGGETEFWSKHKIKPETGKLLIFPAHWTFPHAGKMPLSNDKYIITGWLYEHH